MKWYSIQLRNQFLKDLDRDLKINNNKINIIKYIPLAFKYARKVDLSDQRAGILNLQDVEQIAIIALYEAWANIDWDLLKESPNAERALINYLSSNIVGRIKRGMLHLATGVRVPEREVTKSKGEALADSLFGNWMYSFKLDDLNESQRAYIDSIEWSPEQGSVENEELNDRLTFYMFKYLNNIEREIVRYSYGINCNKISHQKIADKLDMNISAVRMRLYRALDKLNVDKDKEYFTEYL